MRKIILIVVFMFVSALAKGQNGNTVLIRFPGVPNGTCSAVNVAVDDSTGDYYDCDAAGNWFKVGPGGGGGVNSVTGTLPISSSGGANPDISISQSGVATNGYLSSIDWNTFNSKQPALTTHTCALGDFFSAFTAPDTFTCTTPPGGAGTSLTINGGAPLASADFNATTPAAPADSVNVTWQESAGSVSGYIPFPRLDQVLNPTADKTFNPASFQVKFVPSGTFDSHSNQGTIDGSRFTFAVIDSTVAGGGGLGVGFVNQQSDVATGNTVIDAITASAASVNSSGAMNSVVGVEGTAYHRGLGTLSDLWGLRGLAAVVDPQGGTAGNVATAHGVYAYAANEGTGTLVAAIGLHVDSSTNSGTLTNNYGIKIEDQTAGATNYAIKTGLGQVDFGDTVKGASTINAVTGFEVNGTALKSLHLADFDTAAATSAGQIPIWDGVSKYIPGDPLVQGLVAHDAPAAAINPVLTGFFASAAAPGDVTADNDSVRAWALRNGSQVVNLATGGTLYDARQIRALSSVTDSVAVSGTATVSGTVGVTQVTSPWVVDGSGVTQPVSGTFWQATQPISAAALPLPTGASTSALQGAGLPAALGAGGGLKVDGSGTALPISGTVTSNQGGAPWTIDLTRWAGSTLGTPSNFGTSPTAVVAGSVNASIFSGTSAITNNSTTYSGKIAPDVNILGTLGTAFTTAGFVDIKGADGNVFVRQTTGTNLHVVTDATSVTAATLSAETTKVIGTVRNLGNAGGIFDTTQNAAVPANALSMGCNFTTSPASITSGNQGASQCNSKGMLYSQLHDGTTAVNVIAATNALKTDLSSVAGTATVTAAAGVQKVGIVGNANAAIDAATGAAPPANAVLVGGVTSGATGGFLTGIPVCTEFVPINISTATTTLIVTGVSGRQVYICGISLVTAAANNVALISGTGATCGTSTAGMTGGTTAASGYNFAANGGISQGSGLGAINRTETAGDSVCIVTSAATQLSGALSYAIY